MPQSQTEVVSDLASRNSSCCTSMPRNATSARAILWSVAGFEAIIHPITDLEHLHKPLSDGCPSLVVSAPVETSGLLTLGFRRSRCIDHVQERLCCAVTHGVMAKIGCHYLKIYKLVDCGRRFALSMAEKIWHLARRFMAKPHG